MSKRTLEDKLSATQSELELSTFLNKGILATNNELRVRIAELESENSVLKTAENRLAKTEDELDQARQTIEELQKELDVVEEDFKKEIRREQDARSIMQDERDLLYKEVEWRRLAFAGVEKALVWSEENKPAALRKKEQAADDRRGARSSLGSTRTTRVVGASRRDVQVTDPASVTKSLSRRAAALNVRRDAYLESPSPDTVTGSAYKRRRIQLSPDDDDDDLVRRADHEEEEDEEEEPHPPPRKTPTRRGSVPRHQPTTGSSAPCDRPRASSSGRRKDATATAPSTAKRRESRRSSVEPRVKSEARSPPHRQSSVTSVADSDEDPLRMH